MNTGLPLALTMGDPASISSEITAKAWQALAATGPAFAVIADPFWISDQDVPINVIRTMDEVADVFASALPVLQLELPEIARLGQPDPANAPAVIASIERAVRLVQAGEAAAMVTNPISKAVLYQAGFPHPGHTEFLGALTGGVPVMMLAAPMLRVVPVTIHVSLRQALEGVTVAATLGARPTAVWWRVTLPLLAPGLASGAVLAFARSLGEFGATLTFAGSREGVTRTLPLEIYLQREVDADAAVALSVLLVVVAAIVVVGLGSRRIKAGGASGWQ